MNQQIFQTPIAYLKGVGTARAEVLQKELGIKIYADLLRHFPYKYIDRTRFYKISELNPELPNVQLIVRLRSKEILGEKHTKRLVAQVYDDTGVMELAWFQGFSYQALARQLNLCLRTAGTRLHRAKRKLRRLLEGVYQRKLGQFDSTEHPQRGERSDACYHARP